MTAMGTAPPAGALPGGRTEARARNRALAVDRAGAEILDFLWRIQEERQLTSIEMLLILTDAERRLIAILLGVGSET